MVLFWKKSLVGLAFLSVGRGRVELGFLNCSLAFLALDFFGALYARSSLLFFTLILHFFCLDSAVALCLRVRAFFDRELG